MARTITVGLGTVDARRNLGVILLAMLVCLMGGTATRLLSDWASRTRTVFLGNGAIAVEFSLAPAFVAAVWVALSLSHYHRRWLTASVAAFGSGFIASMFVHFLPWLAAIGGNDRNVIGSVYLTAAPTISTAVGMGLAARYVGLTKSSVMVAVCLVLLGAAGLAVGSWIAVPFVMLLAVALPLVIACAAKGVGSGRLHALWLWAGMLSAPVAFFFGIQLGHSLSKLLK